MCFSTHQILDSTLQLSLQTTPVYTTQYHNNAQQVPRDLNKANTEHVLTRTLSAWGHTEEQYSIYKLANVRRVLLKKAASCVAFVSRLLTSVYSRSDVVN